jgi:hypothetical protein
VEQRADNVCGLLSGATEEVSKDAVVCQSGVHAVHHLPGKKHSSAQVALKYYTASNLLLCSPVSTTVLALQLLLRSDTRPHNPTLSAHRTSAHSAQSCCAAGSTGRGRRRRRQSSPPPLKQRHCRRRRSGKGWTSSGRRRRGRPRRRRMRSVTRRIALSASGCWPSMAMKIPSWMRCGGDLPFYVTRRFLHWCNNVVLAVCLGSQ